MRGPEMASTSASEAPEACIVRHCLRGFRICRRTRGLAGSDVAKARRCRLEICCPPIRNAL
eukprot:7832961-Alexandrium_andersonii.AAC.1